MAQALVVALLVLGLGLGEAQKYSLVATGVTGLLTIPIAWLLIKLDNRQPGFYRQRAFQRQIRPGEVIWMLLLGVSVCHLANMLLAELFFHDAVGGNCGSHSGRTDFPRIDFPTAVG